MSSVALNGTAGAAQKLQDAFVRWDTESVRHQNRRLSFVIFAITLGPLAVLLLATQALVFPRGGSTAIVLIALELTALTIALWIPFLKIGRAHDRWIASRLKAEILRRERFLLFAQVGPYLNLQPPAAAAQVDRRLLTLDDELGDAVGQLPLADTQGSWRDALEDAVLVTGPPYSDVVHGAREYLQQRVIEQRKWFVRKSHDHDRRSMLFEDAARVTLTLALIVAAIHLGLLIVQSAKETNAYVLLLSAIVLPAMGSAFVAMQSATGSKRLARSYGYYASALEPLEASLLALVDGASARTAHHNALRLRRLVLAVEQLLSDELRQWWMIMALKEPRAST